VAAVRGLADRIQEPAHPKVSHAQPPKHNNFRQKSLNMLDNCTFLYRPAKVVRGVFRKPEL